MARKIIMHDDPQEFKKELITHTHDGWQLDGDGHGVKPEAPPDEKGFYTQAVKKD